jgi:uncharacterized protein YjiS (DUF1127 family)
MFSSQSAIAAVRHQSTPEQISRVAAGDRYDIPPELTSAESFEASPAVGQAEATWLSMLWLFLEGFAVYGASLPGLATTAVTVVGSEVARRPPEYTRRQRRQPISRIPSSARAEMTVLERGDAIDRTAFGKRIPSRRDGCQSAAEKFDRYRSVHPGWLSMIWRAVASEWAKRRREREIKRAVAALAEYDDRLLRDMGFSHRSQIEQTLRNGRDC